MKTPVLLDLDNCQANYHLCPKLTNDRLTRILSVILSVNKLN